MKEYAVYQGDEFQFIGTAPEVMERMGWKSTKVVTDYASPGMLERSAKKRNPIIVIKIEDEEETE